ncbi:MAG: hypothetical protein A3J38_03120 [Gammaproteobacteria bacterium RIFCSPHIGHO2_12_FULL_45_9]|nr:MAG: hypothetical protein A3J38_03120 [Gammaproteobacteria bacterium RIFCSPHIGHO2_12_FULL_45_9]
MLKKIGMIGMGMMLLPMTVLACPVIQVCFTPKSPCTEYIVRAILHARHSIEMQAYSFTSREIAEALVQVASRGVKVRIVLDKTQFAPDNMQSFVPLFLDSAIHVFCDSKPNIAHNKVLIIDQRLVETGSFNYTYAAERYNAENVLLIEDMALAEQYEANWQSRVALSTEITAENFDDRAALCHANISYKKHKKHWH